MANPPPWAPRQPEEEPVWGWEEEAEERFVSSKLNAKQQQASNLMKQARPGTRTLIGYGGAFAGGKLLDIMTPIPTPGGYKLNKDLMEGDTVFDENGQPARVVIAHPIVLTPESFLLTFDDGSEIKACADHLWFTSTYRERIACARRTPGARAKRRATRPSRATGGRGELVTYLVSQRNQVSPHTTLPPPPLGSVKTTREIADTISANHSVANSKPLELPPAQLLIDPYLLGAWLGDGSTSSGVITTMDKEVVQAFVDGGFAVQSVHQQTGNKASEYRFEGLQQALKGLGVFGNKHIPPVYLRGSKEQRVALLQGLMDTDGTASCGVGVEFGNTNRNIVDGVYELVVSLGWRTRITEHRATFNGWDCGPFWRMKWSPGASMFRIPRKVERQCFPTRKGITRNRYIVSCKPIEPCPMRCITVANPSGLYLVSRSMIPTHNTFWLGTQARNLSLSFPGNRILVGRQTLTSLKTTTMDQFFRVTPKSLIKRYHSTENWVKIHAPQWPDGLDSTIFFRGLEDYEQRGSEEYGAVLIDEAHETTPEAFRYFLSRLRHQLPLKVARMMRMQCFTCGGMSRTADCAVHGPTIGNGLRYYLLAAANPWPGWFTDVFFKREMTLLEGLGGASVHFIQALPKDNPYNDGDGPAGNYEAFLRATLTPEEQKRFVEGRFDVFVGLVYENFESSVHMWRRPNIPPYKKVIGGLDFGGESRTAHFTAGLVSVVGNDGRRIRVAEFKERGPDIAERQLKWMMAVQEKWADPIKGKIRWRADKTQQVGIQMFRKLGFDITPSTGGNDSVDEGIKRVARELNKDAAGIPGSFYLPGLVEWEKEMKEYRRDPDTMKVVKSKDDLVDADRYSSELLDLVVGDPALLYRGRLGVVA